MSGNVTRYRNHGASNKKYKFREMILLLNICNYHNTRRSVLALVIKPIIAYEFLFN